jgi:ABC-type branched-subunit amino acid transport system ATPase component
VATLIRGLAERGLTVILVEHHVEMVMAVSDRVTAGFMCLCGRGG